MTGGGKQWHLVPAGAAPHPRMPRHHCREGGWSGVAFSREGPDPAALAAARGTARDVAVYRGARRVRTLRTCLQPYALTFLPAGAGGGGSGAECLALAEMHVVGGVGVSCISCGCVSGCRRASTDNV